MPIFERESLVEVPVKELFDWHNRPQVFERLTPPWDKIRVIEKRGGIQNGSRMVLEIRQGPFRRRWVAVHSDYVEGRQFCDEQVQGPFAQWVHLHQFYPEGDGASRLKDHIEYKAPFGALGQWAAGNYISRKLNHTFAFRHTRTQQDLKRYHPQAMERSLKIVISGASGLLGTALSTFLACAGHRVHPLTRRPPQLGGTGIIWNPQRGEVDKASLENADAVIHLAGENIGAGRWTLRRKEMIRDSRVKGTKFLAQTLASLQRPPKTFIVASAVGFYGNREGELLTEDSPSGAGFLPEVCRAWEDAAEPARLAGIRVVNLRTGIVLSSLGGALAKMLPPFQMGLGGKIGSGNQWMSWISLEDMLGVFYQVLFTPSLSGPVNATAPWPVTNSAFTKILGRVLGRPTLFPMPASLVTVLFGEMGKALLLEGQQVKPAKLEKSGFQFLYPELEAALRWELGK